MTRSYLVTLAIPVGRAGAAGAGPDHTDLRAGAHPGRA